MASALPSSSQGPRRGTELCTRNAPYVSAEWMGATPALSKANKTQAYTKYSCRVSFALLISIPLDKMIPNGMPLASPSAHWEHFKCSFIKTLSFKYTSLLGSVGSPICLKYPPPWNFV